MAKIIVMLSAICRLYVASLASSVATLKGSCSIKGMPASLSETICAHSYEEKRSNKPSEANSTKWSLVGSTYIILIYSKKSYLRFD